MTAAPSGSGAAPRQLALPFGHQPAYVPADFIESPGNADALAWLRRTADWPHLRLALWGSGGCGKTHLLHVWAQRLGATRLAGAALADALPPPATPLAVDDADSAGERPLLHLLNAAFEAGQPVLLAARAAPARWPVQLPDLASRLRGLTAVEIGAPDDGMLRALLARLLADRQLLVAEAVQDWLLLRLPRSPAALRLAAAQLDHLALAHGRRVTRAMAGAVLTGMANHDNPNSPAGSAAQRLF